MMLFVPGCFSGTGSLSVDEAKGSVFVVDPFLDLLGTVGGYPCSAFSQS